MDPKRKSELESDAISGRSKDNRSGDSQSDNDSEWLRDQTGEDHNLSGSSTYRTLPPQPDRDDPSSDEDAGDHDTKKRQSNR